MRLSFKGVAMTNTSTVAWIEGMSDSYYVKKKAKAAPSNHFADKSERGFGRNEGTLGEDGKNTRQSAVNARKSEI